MGYRIQNYMKNCSKANNMLNHSSWIFFIGIFGMGSSVTLGDYIAFKLGSSLTILIAAIIISLNIMMMFFTLKTYLFVVIITYGLLNGVCTGIVYGVTMGVVCSWFRRRIGSVLGVLVTGFGLSTLFATVVQTTFIHHYKDVNDKFPLSYVILGCIFIVFQLIGSFLLKKCPTEGPRELDRSFSDSNLLNSIVQPKADNEMMPHKIIYNVNFWILWITFSLLSACILLNITFNQAFWYYFIKDERSWFYIPLGTILGMLFSAVGSLAWGLAIDRFKYKPVMLLLTISLVLISTIFFVCSQIYVKKDTNSTENNYFLESKNTVLGLYYVWTVLIFFIPSGIYAIFPQICMQLFGRENFIGNYGMLFTGWSSGALIAGGISISILANKNNKPEEYFISIVLSEAIMTSFAVLFTIPFNSRHRYRSGWMYFI